MMNVLEKESKEKYLKRIYTDKGRELLENYLNSLCLKYLDVNQYPFKLGIVLGIPMFKYTQLIRTKELLLERIKSYAQILCVKIIDIKLKDGSIVKLELGEI